MAVTIQQYASNLTMANSDLIWVVTSNSSSRDQYQFICALQDGCGNTLTTVKQQPNPSFKGVFDLGRIVKQYLGYDTGHFEAGVDGFFEVNNETAKFFKVAFGEEYGTSPSSSVVVYNGINNTTPAAPAQTGSRSNYYFIDGVLDPNYGSWEWVIAPYYSPQLTPSSASFTKNVCMTDAPRTQSARNSDYLTVSALNGNIDGNQTNFAQDLYAIEIKLYDTGGLIYSESYYNTVASNSDAYGGPRTSPNQLWSAVYTLSTCTSSIALNKQTSGSLLLTMPIGPANITAYGDVDLAAQDWTYYTINFRPQKAANSINTSASWDQFTIYKTTGNCDYNGVRFAWINDYGVWDYYTFGLQNDKTTAMDRGIYKQNFVNYSTTTNAVNYNISRRGNNAYYTNIDEIYTANSDWLTQEEADWLEQLFYSPNVYIQEGSNMIPVIINSSDFVSKTNPRTQKNFQYAITYTLANSKRPR
jgi:hypothetical protein